MNASRRREETFSPRAVIGPLAALAVMAGATWPAFGFVYENRKWNASASNPVVYKINTTEAPSYFASAIAAAFQTWTDAEGKDFAFSYGGTTATRTTDADKDNAVFWNTRGTGMDDSTLGVTTNWFTAAGVVVGSDLEFNGRQPFSSDGAGQTFDLQTVATHEAGHWLVLGHEDDVPSVMATFYFGVARSLFADDVAGIQFIYPAKAADNEAPVVSITSPTDNQQLSVKRSGTLSVKWTYTEANPASAVIKGQKRSATGSLLGERVLKTLTQSNLTAGTQSRTDTVTVPSNAPLVVADIVVEMTDAGGLTGSDTASNGVKVVKGRRSVANSTAGPLRVLNLQSQDGGTSGLLVRYTVTHDAIVQVRLLTANGRVVAELPAREAAPGVNQLLWSKRSASGRPIARGSYLLEIRARDEAGNSVRVVRPVNMR